jgi:hypothetical protein
MRKGLSVLLMSAALASGPRAIAQADAALSGPPASATTLRMDGTIDKYDASAGILSLSTSNGTVRVPLAATARIRQGWHTIDPSKLEKLAGYRARIRYSESGGTKAVESIHVFGKIERGVR